MNGKKISVVRKALRFVLGAFCFLLVLWILPQLWIAGATKAQRYEKIGDLPEAQAILVLGARVYPDRPSLMLAERLDEAAAMFKAGKAPVILVSGASLGPTADEPKTMRAYLEERGIPAEAILEDEGGKNSYRSVWRAKNVFHFDHVLIATTAYHLPRCLYLAKHLGLEAEGCGARNRIEYNMPFNYVREGLAQIKALYNLYIHPPRLEAD